MLTRLLVAVALALPVATAAAQSDLDRFMERVLARRDENWKKLQQYVLEERETLRVDGAVGSALYGFTREYSWFLRDGIFVRSPVKADGVTIGEAERRRAEDELDGSPAAARGATDGARAGRAGAALRLLRVLPRVQVRSRAVRAGRPRAVRRTRRAPHRVLPDADSLPKDPRGRTAAFASGTRKSQEKMNKVSLVTLWVDPAEHQIVQVPVPQHRHGLPARPRLRAR